MAKKQKLKTHKGTQKRFGMTGNGKFTRRKGNISHNRKRLGHVRRKIGGQTLRKIQIEAIHCGHTEIQLRVKTRLTPATIRRDRR